MRDTVSVVSLAARSETTLLLYVSLLYSLASTVLLPKNPLHKYIYTTALSINFVFSFSLILSLWFSPSIYVSII